MKLKQLLEELNQLAKERPEALEMEVCISNSYGWKSIDYISADIDFSIQSEIIMIYPY